MLLKSKNNQHEYAQGKSYLTSAGTVGQTVYTLYNTAGFDDDYVMQIGETGQDLTELMLISGAPGDTLATVASSAKFPHPADTPVYCYRYNQVVFKVSTSGTAGTATAIANGTITITPDSDYTVFDYTSSGTADAYKTQFRNSALTATSPESDWIAYEGYAPYSLAGMRSRVRGKITANIQDDQINNWIDEWRQEMQNAALSINEDYGMGTVDISFSGTAQEGTISNEDFVRVRRVWHTTDGVNWYKSTKRDYNDVDPNQVTNAEIPYHYFRSDNVIGRMPHDTGGTLRIAYDSLGTVLRNDNDLLPISMRGYSKSFVDYALSQAYRHPTINKIPQAENLEKSADNARNDFLSMISPRDRTGVEFIEFTDPVSSDYWGL